MLYPGSRFRMADELLETYVDRGLGRVTAWGWDDPYHYEGWRGAIVDDGMAYFDVRLARDYPTLELRVCDVMVSDHPLSVPTSLPASSVIDRKAGMDLNSSTVRFP